MLLYDWKTASILPAILSNLLMAVGINLVTDPNTAPLLTLVPDYITPDSRAEYMTWARQYFKVSSSFKHYLFQCMSREITAFLCTGTVQ